jgi:hypothetical protein
MIDRRVFLSSVLGGELWIGQMRRDTGVPATRNRQGGERPKTNWNDLDEILRNPLYDGRMREAARTYRRHRCRAMAKGRPLTGTFYWVPIPTKRGIEWTIQEFFDCWKPSGGHVYVWKHIQDSLNVRWGRRGQGVDYRSLPRGRVSMLSAPSARWESGRYLIRLGGGCPVSPANLSKIRKRFNLDPSTPAVIDERFSVDPDQAAALAQTFGCRSDFRSVNGVEIVQRIC